LFHNGFYVVMLLFRYFDVSMFSLFFFAVDSSPQAAKMSCPREARMVVVMP